MIYYSLSVLMLAGIREILIITNPEYIKNYENLLGDGSRFGIYIKYKEQDKPRGIADAFLLGEDFINNEKVCLILGDNIFYGQGFVSKLEKASSYKEGAVIFAYYVLNPSDFGVVEIDESGKAISLEEKPLLPKSNYAVPGLYFYDNTVVEKAKKLKPSKRGELEITDLNRLYLFEGKLNVELLGRGFAWLDTGTYDGLANATEFVRTIQKRTGLYIACLEEIAFNKGYIDRERLIQIGKELKNTDYGKYLLRIAGEKE